MRKLSAMLLIGTMSVAAFAQPVIDGLLIDTANWGLSYDIQDTNTGFGDNYNELDQLFYVYDANNIYLGIPGNLADNNALTIFFDTDALAGSHPLATAPDPNVPCVGFYPRILRYFQGASIDPAAVFTPDYALTISVGKFPGQSDTLLVYACDLTNLNTGEVTVLGIGAVGTGNGLLTGNSGVEIAIDNSNADGVGPWDPNFPTPADSGHDPTSATTGIEISIPRAMLGLTQAQDFYVFAYITNNAQSDEGIGGPCGRAAYGSNQALPGLGGWGNMAAFNGDTVLLDISANPGPAYITLTVGP